VYQSADQPAASAPADAATQAGGPLASSGPARAVPGTAAEALALVRNGLDWLAAVDAGELTGAERAEVLRGLAAAESVHLAATAKVVSAFDAAEDYVADGHGGTRSWLVWQTRTTRPAAAAVLAWTRRLAAHPAVAAALRAGSVSPSYGRRICEWADALPADARATGAEILVQAAIGGADIGDLAGLFEEIRARTARPDTDADAERRGFAQRQLFLDSYYRGHGSLRADLTPPAAAALQAVLDTLGGKAGPEDERSRAQRDHDALEEACRLLIASGCLPQREGQPVQIQLQMTLSQLLGQPEADPALAASIAARGTPAPPGADCDAQIVPVVTATINQDILASLTARYLNPDGGRTNDGGTGLGDGGPAGTSSDPTHGRASRAAAGLAIADALRLLSGPGGLAAILRSQLPAPASTISLPLDIGAATDTSPSTSAAPSPAATSTAASPAATPPPSAATSITCATAPTAATPASLTAACSAPSTTSSPSTAGAGNSPSTPTAQPPPSAQTANAPTAVTHRRQQRDLSPAPATSPGHQHASQLRMQSTEPAGLARLIARQREPQQSRLRCVGSQPLLRVRQHLGSDQDRCGYERCKVEGVARPGVNLRGASGADYVDGGAVSRAHRQRDELVDLHPPDLPA
jgi:hypothetical protein